MYGPLQHERQKPKKSANLTAYHAATNLLVAADKTFMAMKSPGTSQTGKNAVSSILSELKDGATAKISKEQEPKGEVVWFTPAEVAVKFKLTENEVKTAIEKGDIKAKKFGSTWRISSKDLD